MNTLDLIQGSAEWHDHRAKYFTASEAPAMMGASKYQTRTELLRQKATGIAADVDESKQRLFDRGHAAEAAARPIVEAIIGDGLFPVTGTLEVDGLPLLASFDGLTMMEDIAWETKLWNAALADAVRAGQLEPHYYWQMEQQLLVSGAERVYFTTSDGTPENTVGMWYESDPERRAALIASWKQFAEDLANYQHVEAKPEPTAATIEALPALLVQVEGRVLATNLDAFKASAQTFIDNIKTELVNDQDFADADKMVKFLKDGEERLALAKQQALAQTASIDELFRTVDAISEQMRSKRLALDKLVKAEKVNRKAAIVSQARQALDDHVAKLNERIGGRWMPSFSDGRFAEAVSGLKSLDSMRDKVSVALANAKIEANDIAYTIEANHKSLEAGNGTAAEGMDYFFLFPDFASVCTKSTEDFANLFTARLAAHREREEAERERIRQEEADRITREAARADLQTKAQAAQDARDNDQRGKADAGSNASGEAADVGSIPQPVAASTPPIQDHFSHAGNMVDGAMITEFLALQACSPADKKAMRATVEKWETFRMKTEAARRMQVAA